MPIRLLIVDDHPVVRDGLRGIFTGDERFEVIGEAANGAEAVALAEARQPDVVLMDLRMPEVDGVTAITELARRGVGARILVLTTYDTDSDPFSVDRSDVRSGRCGVCGCWGWWCELLCPEGRLRGVERPEGHLHDRQKPSLLSRSFAQDRADPPAVDHS